MSCTLFHIIIPQKMSSLSDGNFGQFSTVEFLEPFIGSRLGTPPHFGAEKGAGGILGCVAKSFWEVPNTQNRNTILLLMVQKSGKLTS